MSLKSAIYYLIIDACTSCLVQVSYLVSMHKTDWLTCVNEHWPSGLFCVSGFVRIGFLADVLSNKLETKQTVCCVRVTAIVASVGNVLRLWPEASRWTSNYKFCKQIIHQHHRLARIDFTAEIHCEHNVNVTKALRMFTPLQIVQSEEERER